MTFPYGMEAMAARNEGAGIAQDIALTGISDLI
jgi:hypothetical protein